MVVIQRIVFVCATIALTFHAQPVYAYQDRHTISAYVVSDIDGQPIQGARIYNARQILLGITDKSGRFEIESSTTTDSIVIVALGHETRTISVSESNLQHIVLKSRTILTRTIDVLEYRSAEDVVGIISSRLAYLKAKYDTISYRMYTLVEGEGGPKNKLTLRVLLDVITKNICIPGSNSPCIVEVISARTKGNNDSTFILDITGALIDITSETYNIRGTNYPLPLSTDAPSYYTYSFLEDDNTSDNIKLIAFKPVHLLSPGFTGQLSYNIDDYSVLRVSMHLVNSESPPIDSITFDLDYLNSVFPWIPGTQTFKAWISVSLLFGTIESFGVLRGKLSIYKDSEVFPLPQIDSSKIRKLDSLQALFYARKNENIFTEKGFRIYSDSSDGLYIQPIIQRTIPDNLLFGIRLTSQLSFLNTDLMASVGKLKSTYGQINFRFLIGRDSGLVISLRASHSPEILQQNPIDRNFYGKLSINGLNSIFYPDYYTYTLSTRFSMIMSLRFDECSLFTTLGYGRYYQYGDPQYCSECLLADNLQSRVTFYNIGVTNGEDNPGFEVEKRSYENVMAAYQGGINLATEQVFHQLIMRSGISRTFLSTYHGDMRYSLHLYGGVSSANTPNVFDFFMTPRLPLFGSNFDILTIKPRSVTGRAVVSLNAGINFGQIPYRLLGIKLPKGGLPALAFSTGFLGYVSNASLLAFNSIKTHLEIGGSISNIPTGLIDILRIKFDFRWRVGTSAVGSTPFGWSITFTTTSEL